MSVNLSVVVGRHHLHRQGGPLAPVTPTGALPGVTCPSATVSTRSAIAVSRGSWVIMIVVRLVVSRHSRRP
jgi:hypothetical protein